MLSLFKPTTLQRFTRSTFNRSTLFRMSSSTVRVKVGSVDMLQDGKMKEVPFPKEDSESKILLSKVSSNLIEIVSFRSDLN